MNLKKGMALLLSIAICAVGLKATNPTPAELATVKVGSVGKKLLLSVSDAEVQEMRLSIEDTEGVILHNQTVNLKGGVFSCQFNLQNLEAGNYRLIIKKKREKLIQPFEVTYSKVVVSEAKREQTFLPYVMLKGVNLDVSVLQDKEAKVQVAIFDNAGMCVFEAAYVALVVHKRFNLSRLAQGVYIVEVATEGRETEYFTVNL